MEYRFTCTRKPGYLHVQVQGDNSPETVMRYLRQVYDTCLETRCPSVLMEENLEGPGLNLGEIFGIVSEGSPKVWPVVQRIAYVDVNPQHSLRDMKFAETAAVNRSVNMRVFAGVPEAESWLLRQLNVPPEKP